LPFPGTSWDVFSWFVGRRRCGLAANRRLVSGGKGRSRWAGQLLLPDQWEQGADDVRRRWAGRGEDCLCRTASYCRHWNGVL